MLQYSDCRTHGLHRGAPKKGEDCLGNSDGVVVFACTIYDLILRECAHFASMSRCPARSGVVSNGFIIIAHEDLLSRRVESGITRANARAPSTAPLFTGCYAALEGRRLLKMLVNYLSL
jgi:hypothetical protein